MPLHLAAWGLYVLLRPVNRHLALHFLLLDAVGVAIQGASMLGMVSALLQGDASSHMQAWSAAQLEGLAYLSHAGRLAAASHSSRPSIGIS